MPRKHVLWVYALCARLQNERENFPLLVIAGSSVNSHIFGILEKDHAWGKAGVFVMNPTDGELAWLYKHTLLTLHPSFEGGLGLSVTEAIHFGRPCIAADAPSLIEASGGLAEHLPRDETLWAEAICRILDQEPRHRSPCPQQEMTDKSIVARLIEEFGPP
jgi:glycosyltransferase involved in cell wall biosynthesis